MNIPSIQAKDKTSNWYYSPYYLTPINPATQKTNQPQKDKESFQKLLEREMRKN